MDIKPSTPEPTPSSNSGTQSESANSVSVNFDSNSVHDSVETAESRGWFGKILGCCFPQRGIRERSISEADPEEPMVYQKYRNLGAGITGQVHLVHKVPECRAHKIDTQHSSSSPTDDAQTVLSKTQTLIQVGPKKVSGIRELVMNEPPLRTSSSELLAKKHYTLEYATTSDDHEYNLLREMDHPNIVNLKDAEVEAEIVGGENFHFHTTLYTESGIADLLSLRKIAPLTLKEFVGITAQIISGVSYLHDNGITHNDLKPHNIILMPDMTVKIIDFGLAVDFTSDYYEEMLMYGEFCTLGYRAPEIENEGIHSITFVDLQKVDCWSSGCIFYELFAGHSLFHGKGTSHYDLEKYLKESIDDIPNSMEGWSVDDVLEVKSCLRELLSPAPEKRHFSRIKAFIKTHNQNSG